jgi:hypothetical protein
MSKVRGDTSYRGPVLVVGPPRSGTTLLQAILVNSGIYFPMPETHFFSQVAYGAPERNLSKEDRQKVMHILAKKVRIKIDEQIIWELESKIDIFEYIVGTFNMEKKETFLEKTPRHVFFYKEIMKYYPDARFVCIIREPKNIVSSQISKSSKPGKSIIRLSFLYNKIANSILDVRKNDNVLVMRYEDLTNEPEKTTRNLFEFLNIPYDPSFVDNVAAPPGILLPHETWKNRNLELEKIQQNDPDKWRDALSEGQANVVNYLTKSYASQFGYVLNYRSTAVCFGVMRDLSKLASRGELRRVFSKVHG